MSLLVRPEAFQNRIEDFGFEFLSLNRARWSSGQKYNGETEAENWQS